MAAGGYAGSSPPPAETGTVCYDDNVIGYLAVPSEEAEDILRRGYVLSMEWNKRVPPPNAPMPLIAEQPICHTRRREVPFSKEPAEAVQQLRKWREKVEFTTVLQLLRVSKDGARLPSDQFEDGAVSVLPDPVTNILDKKFIDAAVVMSRGVSDYQGVPCPFCGQNLDGLEEKRGKVGLSVFVRNAFMVVPCPNEKCKQMQQDRQDRLDGMPKMKLYHACSREVADLIRSSGGKMIRGCTGAGGAGMYFAHSQRETEWKAEIKEGGSMVGLLNKFKPNSKRVVVLEIEAKLGNMHLGKRDEQKSFKDLIRSGYDSCVLDRGETGYPGNTVPDAPVSINGKSVMGGTHPGYEFVIYSWDQVKVLGEVQRDPVPGSPDATID